MPAMRLGFAVKTLGRPLPSNDARRHQNNPHLRVSIGYLRAIFAYLREIGATMYRMSSDIAPYCTHPAMPQFHGQIAECAADLAQLGAEAREQGLRLSLHPSQYVVINSPDEALVAKSVADLIAQAAILDAMGLGPEAVVVLHVGGVYDDRLASIERFIRAYQRLPEAVRRRLVLENDDTRFSVGDVLHIHAATGVPLIYDYQHHMCNNREQMGVGEALRAVLQTWPAGVRPKIHFSTPRTELKTVQRKNRATGKAEPALQPPQWTNHSDYVNPFECIQVLRAVPDLPFDVMLECKLKDVAMLRLREDLARYAPDVALRFGIEPREMAPPLGPEE